MTSVSNGFSTQNTARIEGGKKAGQECLQCEARASSGGIERKDRLVSIENSTVKLNPFSIKEVATVEELLEQLFVIVPELDHPALGIRISSARLGAIHRPFFDDALPSDVYFLYLSLYLKKHPPILDDKN